MPIEKLSSIDIKFIGSNLRDMKAQRLIILL